MMLKLNDPDRLDHRDPAFIDKVAGVFERTIWPYHRAEVRGLDRMPAKPGAIYIGNHNGYPYMTEYFLFTSALFARFGMTVYPYTLAHDVTLKLPLVNQFLTKYGCVRADRDNARRVLERGESLAIYPGGADELMRPHRERTRLRFQGRLGYVRLALAYNRPIVPVVAVGGHSTALILDDLPWLAELIGARTKIRVASWPLMLSIPWGLTLGPIIPPYVPWPSRIIVEVLEPIVLPPAPGVSVSEKAWARECADLVERTIEQAMVRLEAERVGKRARGERQPVRQLLGGLLGKKPRVATSSMAVPPSDPMAADAPALAAR
jgi:1-acyl-sn-glycerol-3-phosphate acyltransferase